MEGSVDAKLKAVRSWQDECDLRVDLAEELWGQRRFSDSIVKYDTALAIAKTHTTRARQGRHDPRWQSLRHDARR